MCLKFQEARERSRQEEARKKKEIEAAEERARQIRLEEERKKVFDLILCSSLRYNIINEIILVFMG